MAHAALERERAELSQLRTAAVKPEDRRSDGSAKPLGRAYRSKAQRRAMIRSAMAEASKQKKVRWRGEGSVAQQLGEQKRTLAAVADANVASRIDAYSKSCHRTATGLPRTLPTVAAVAYKAPTSSDGGGRGAAAIASRKRKHAEVVRNQRIEQAQVVKKRKDGRPLSLAQQRKAAALPQPAKLAPPAPKPAAKPHLTAEQLRRQAEAKRDAAQLFANARKRTLEAEAHTG